MTIKKKEELLTYKGKPLVRKSNVIYYGNQEDKFIIYMIVNKSEKIGDIDVSTNITIQLRENTADENGKVIKKAEREGLYQALDMAYYWLADALNEGA